ncbi:MAG TPA: mechanosensitive ion channel [Anaerolineae bacterium]|nr:mechanosensitive ion channel [Anaerolineae bacterium]
MMTAIREFIDEYGPQITAISLRALYALVILFVGWLVALVLAAVVRRVLRWLKVDQRLATVSGDDGIKISVESWASTAAFYLTMLFVLAEFLGRIGLGNLGVPMADIGAKVTEYVPRILGAGLLFLVAWLVANVVKMLILRITGMTRVDERLVEQAELSSGRPLSVSASLANAAYWLSFLFFLPSILKALRVDAEGVSGMLSQVLAYIPMIVGAAIVLFIGWFVARIVRQIVTNFVAAAGGDQLGERVGMTSRRSLSGLLGTLAYAFIMIPVVVQALDTLGMKEGPAVDMLGSVTDIIPKIVGSAVLLGIAYWVGSWVADLVASILQNVGLNRLPGKLGFNQVPAEGDKSPSEIVGTVTLAAILLFAAAAAAGNMGFDTLKGALEQIISLGGDAILAVAILGGGVYLANLARTVIMNTMGADGAWVSNIARVAVLVGAAAMALGQIEQIGDSGIIQTAFQALAWAIGIAIALAFGLGGRDAAAAQIGRWMDKS